MARIVAVHGIAKTYITAPQMAASWGSALTGGVALNGTIVLPNDIAYVAYGDVFRPRGRFLGEDEPPVSVDDLDAGLETELLLAWWRAASTMDDQVVPPDDRTLGLRSSARAALLALAGARFLTGVSERALIWWVKQVSAYFTDDVVRGTIQDRFAAQIAPDTRVVVAHSLGSVVAYEALCANPQWTVTDLVTLGSPLGVPHVVTHRLRPTPHQRDGRFRGHWPGSVVRWVNLSDDGDFVALQPRLREVFGDRVADVAISNGMHAHQVERYLTAPETGAAIAAGLQ